MPQRKNHKNSARYTKRKKLTPRTVSSHRNRSQGRQPIRPVSRVFKPHVVIVCNRSHAYKGRAVTPFVRVLKHSLSVLRRPRKQYRLRRNRLLLKYRPYLLRGRRFRRLLHSFWPPAPTRWQLSRNRKRYSLRKFFKILHRARHQLRSRRTQQCLRRVRRRRHEHRRIIRGEVYRRTWSWRGLKIWHRRRQEARRKKRVRRYVHHVNLRRRAHLMRHIVDALRRVGRRKSLSRNLGPEIQARLLHFFDKSRVYRSAVRHHTRHQQQFTSSLRRKHRFSRYVRSRRFAAYRQRLLARPRFARDRYFRRSTRRAVDMYWMTRPSAMFLARSTYQRENFGAHRSPSVSQFNETTAPIRARMHALSLNDFNRAYRSLSNQANVYASPQKLSLVRKRTLYPAHKRSTVSFLKLYEHKHNPMIKKYRDLTEKYRTFRLQPDPNYLSRTIQTPFNKFIKKGTSHQHLARALQQFRFTLKRPRLFSAPTHILCGTNNARNLIYFIVAIVSSTTLGLGDIDGTTALLLPFIPRLHAYARHWWGRAKLFARRHWGYILISIVAIPAAYVLYKYCGSGLSVVSPVFEALRSLLSSKEEEPQRPISEQNSDTVQGETPPPARRKRKKPKPAEAIPTYSQSTPRYGPKPLIVDDSNFYLRSDTFLSWLREKYWPPSPAPAPSSSPALEVPEEKASGCEPTAVTPSTTNDHTPRLDPNFESPWLPQVNPPVTSAPNVPQKATSSQVTGHRYQNRGNPYAELMSPREDSPASPYPESSRSAPREQKVAPASRSAHARSGSPQSAAASSRGASRGRK